MVPQAAVLLLAVQPPSTVCRVACAVAVRPEGQEVVEDGDGFADAGGDGSGGGFTLPAHKKKQTPADRDATLLRSQLEPLSTPMVRNRLVTAFGYSKADTHPEVVCRADVLDMLVRSYEREGPNGRVVRPMQGQQLSRQLAAALLRELGAVDWPSTIRERPTVRAEGYITLQRPPSPPLDPYDADGGCEMTAAHGNVCTQHAGTTFEGVAVETSKILSHFASSQAHARISKTARQAAAKLARFRRLWELAQEAIEEVYRLRS